MRVSATSCMCRKSVAEDARNDSYVVDKVLTNNRGREVVISKIHGKYDSQISTEGATLALSFLRTTGSHNNFISPSQMYNITMRQLLTAFDVNLGFRLSLLLHLCPLSCDHLAGHACWFDLKHLSSIVSYLFQS